MIVADISGEVFNTRSELVGYRLSVKLTGCLDMETAPGRAPFLVLGQVCALRLTGSHPGGLRLPLRTRMACRLTERR